jgi:hypothetical protein
MASCAKEGAPGIVQNTPTRAKEHVNF